MFLAEYFYRRDKIWLAFVFCFFFCGFFFLSSLRFSSFIARSTHTIGKTPTQLQLVMCSKLHRKIVSPLFPTYKQSNKDKNNLEEKIAIEDSDPNHFFCSHYPTLHLLLVDICAHSFQRAVLKR